MVVFMNNFQTEEHPEDIASKIQNSLEQFKAGNKDAFNVIAEHFLPMLKAFARTLLSSEYDADDAVQETLIRAYKYLGNFRGDAALSTWFCRILVNQVKTVYRKQKRLNDLFVEYNKSGLGKSFHTDASQEYSSTEFCKVIYHTINELPAISKNVLTLWLKGLKYSEIAQYRHCSIGTVKSQLSRARKKLSQQLDRKL